MATVESTQAPANAATVVVDPVIAGWDGNIGNIPEGYKYDDKTKALKKMQRRSGGKSKGKKPKDKLAVPSDGFKTENLSEDGSIKGYVIGKHAKLKPTDFFDVLDYHRWNVWYTTKQADEAKRDLETARTLGNTPEERRANMENARIMKMAQNAVERQLSDGGSEKTKAAMAKMLEEMLLKLQ